MGLTRGNNGPLLLKQTAVILTNLATNAGCLPPSGKTPGPMSPEIRSLRGRRSIGRDRAGQGTRTTGGSQCVHVELLIHLLASKVNIHRSGRGSPTISPNCATTPQLRLPARR